MNFNHNVLIVAALVAINMSLYAQGEATPEDIALAQQIKADFEDERLAALQAINTYEFRLDSRNEQVMVVETEEEKLISLEAGVAYRPYIFYDEMSSVEQVKVQDISGKKVNITIKDDYYNISEYFYSDARVVNYRLFFEEQGSRYDVRHQKKINDIKYFTSSYFHTVYPIMERKLVFIVPKWLNVELKEMNFDNYDVQRTIEISEDDKSTIHTYTLKRLDKLSKAEGAPGNSHIYPHILILAKSYQMKGEQKTLFNSAKDLYAWYKGLVDKMQDDPQYIEEIVKELTSGKENDIEKIKAIYYWVQDNIRYIAFEDGIAGFQPDACQNVYHNKYGDCKGMANLTKQMLKLAGFDARLTWIGTKRIAYDYSLPTMAVDNHMICTVLLGDKLYFLDPTEKFNGFNEYSGRIEGKQVLIEDGDNFILSKVPKMLPEDNAELVMNHFSIKDGNLVGNVKRQYKGESKTYMLYRVNNQENQDKIDALNRFLTRRDKNLSVSDLNTSNLDERDDVLTINYQLEHKNSVASFGEEIYLDIDSHKEYSNHDFEDRKVGYMFPYKSDFNVETELEIPQGYEVQEVPQTFIKENDIYYFDLGFEQEGNKLIYKKRIKIKKDRLPKDYLPDWNQTIRELNDFYNEQVILKKAN